MMRTFTLIVLLLPTGSNSCSCKTRNNLTWVSRGSSLISSRNKVPPSASSKRPVRRSSAPVNAPFICPKSSLSTSPVGIAPQFTFTSGRCLRLLWLWMARAINSLPDPVSPNIRTVESVGATVSILRKTSRRMELFPTISSKLCSLRISSCK